MVVTLGQQYNAREKPSVQFLVLFEIKRMELLSYSYANSPDSWHKARQLITF